MNSPDTSASARGGARKAILADLACVLVMVVIGTRNHDTDTGLGGVLSVAAPFWVAAVLAHLSPIVRRSLPSSMSSGVYVWVATIGVGMTLRHFVWNRGTALAFIIVASAFLGITMLGWRTVSGRRTVS